MRKIKSVLAVLICGCLLFTENMALTVLAGEEETYPAIEAYHAGNLYEKPEEEEYIKVPIESLEDLYELAENCRLDTWSRGKLVELRADISLQEADFSIPIFAGIFEGNGHTISGLCVEECRADAGLFRYVQEGAQVRNLTVTGNIRPQGSQNNIGGIAAHNYGLIENCIFNGLIAGDNSVGGIAGCNEKSGEIRNCRNIGTILANHSAGGIAGENHGIISDCGNSGQINTYGIEVTYELEDFTAENLEDINSTRNISAHIDCGGIAGISDGRIYNSSNEGDVGYAHTGYNIGGVVGRMHAGYVTGCSNTGRILGRKDVGGIVGQMEPFLELVYLEDKLVRLDEETDTLIDMLDALSDDVRYYRNQSDSLLRNVNANLRTATETMGDLADIAGYLQDVYNRELNGLSEDLQTFGEDLERIETDSGISISGNDISISGNDISISGNDIVNRDDTKGYLDAVEKFSKNAGARLKNMTNAANGQSDNLSNDFDRLEDSLTAACDQTEQLIELLEAGGDVIDADLDAISRQARIVRALASEIRDDLFAYEGVRLEDASMENYDTTAVRQGRLEDCENSGIVEADTNVGGLTGQISIEYDFDPETDIEEAGDANLNLEGQASALIVSCTNRGNITAKKDCVGGIVGKADLGGILQCASYADVTSSAGGYVGGVAGSSAGIIRECYAVGSLSGKSYVGGAAGRGTDIWYSCTMVEIAEAQEFSGAIAGDICGEGTLWGNCFVSENGGVNGMNFYEGAMPVNYSELVSIEGVPEEFGQLKVTFRIEGEVVYEYLCAYGDSIPEEKIPKIPQKEGCYGVWPEFDFSCVTSNKVLEAEYVHWVEGLASEQTSDDGKPLLLAEGEFLPGWSLACTLGECNTLAVVDGSTGQQVYTGPVTVRYLLEDTSKERQVLVEKDGVYVEVESRIMGSYLLFDMEAPGSFKLLEAEADHSMLRIGIAVGGGFLLIVLILLFRRCAKKKREGKNKENDVGPA